MLLTDPEYADVVEAALGQAKRKPLVVDVPDPVFDVPGARMGELTYDELLAEGDPDSSRAIRRTSGRRSRSATPPGPPAGPRAWSPTTAART